MMKYLKKLRSGVGSFVAATCLAVALGGVAPAQAQQDYGKPGEPVHLVVGYQPYWTMGFAPAVLRGKELWKKHLPAGSTVEFQIGLQGAIIVNAMLAGKQHIGYLGDMPSIVSTTKESVGDIRMVAVLGLAQDVCNILLVRKDAPQFNDTKEAIKWVGGKQFATPRGACSDRFAQATFKKFQVEPAAYMNQSIEVITSNFKAGKIDAAVVWEPTATKLQEEGIARRVASGANVGEDDGGFVVMRADLIKQRPDVAKGWLNAELDAQLFTLDPKNAREVARITAQQITGFPERTLWNAHFAVVPESVGGSAVKFTRPFAFTPEAMDLIGRATTFLHGLKAINVDKLRSDAIMPELAQQVLKERGLTAPIGKVVALPTSAYESK